jgi:hypothetical protein
MSKTGWKAILTILIASLACGVATAFAGYGERTYTDLHPRAGSPRRPFASTTAGMWRDTGARPKGGGGSSGRPDGSRRCFPPGRFPARSAG